MNDYRRIRLAGAGYRKLQAMDTEHMHTGQRQWLCERLAEPFHGKTVVVTHHAPSDRSLWGGDGSRTRITAWHRSHERVLAAYASDLENLAAKADYWIHGHMHHSIDYTIGGCRVFANPRGYPCLDGPENGEFDAGATIDF